eukprot:473061_1
MIESTNDENILLITDTINIQISECPIGSGYASDAVTIDCNECSTNTFKIISGNAPCYQCSTNDGFVCNGRNEIIINYGNWFTSFNNNKNQFFSPFNLTQNDAIYAVQCAVKILNIT